MQRYSKGVTRRSAIVAPALLCLPLGTREANAQAAIPKQIVLYIGDSQCIAGYGYDPVTGARLNGYDPAQDVTNPLCLQWKHNNTFATAKDVLDWEPNSNYHLPNNTSAIPICSALPLMRAWAPDLPSGTAVCVVPNGKSGAQLMTLFQAPPTPDGGVWPEPTWGWELARAINRTNAAILASPGNKLALIVWQGGPNDVVRGVSTSAFVSAFIRMAGYLRTQIIGAANCPIIVSGIVFACIGLGGAAGQAAYRNIYNALEIIPTQLLNSAAVYVTDLEGYYRPPYGIPEHWTNDSQRILGTREYGLYKTLKPI